MAVLSYEERAHNEVISRSQQNVPVNVQYCPDDVMLLYQIHAVLLFCKVQSAPLIKLIFQRRHQYSTAIEKGYSIGIFKVYVIPTLDFVTQSLF